MATKTARGFAVRCLHCGEEETVRLDVHDLDTFHCSSCDTEFTTDTVRAEMARWARLLAWLDTAPDAA
jgi:transcription elongation factor Elf1